MITFDQILVERTFKVENTAEMGFLDYVKVRETMPHFIMRVTDKVNDILTNANIDNVKIISVSYPTDELAVISYSYEE